MMGIGEKLEALKAAMKACEVETRAAFDKLVRLNEELRAKGGVTYGPPLDGISRAYHAGPPGESYGMGTCRVEKFEPYDAALGLVLDKAMMDWADKAKALGSAGRELDAAIAEWLKE